MRLFIYADPHWSSYSSIVRSRGEKYSTRLENLIQTMNWIEAKALEEQCDAIICLGDFFDKSELNAEEITALQEVMWSNMDHYMIVGNHEMGRSNLEHSSAHLFSLIPNCKVINNIEMLYDGYSNTGVIMLPYILENNRKPLKEYLSNFNLNKNTIILSHNDISGIQMGKFISTIGFSIEEIEENCDLFINGHLHNEAEIGNKIINLGNITGQNFSEDASKYEHKALILDTFNKSISTLPNPYAMNFYKIDLTKMLPTIDDALINKTLDVLTYPAVATIKVNSNNEFLVKDLLSSATNIIESRCIVEASNSSEESIINADESLDHLAKFRQFVYDNIGTSELIINELERVSK